MTAAIHIHLPEGLSLTPTPQQYAEEVGQSEEAIQMQISRGQIPSVYLDQDENKSRRKRYVNRIAILAKACEDAQVSLVTT